MVQSGAFPAWAMAFRISGKPVVPSIPSMLAASLPHVVAVWHHWQSDDTTGCRFDFPAAERGITLSPALQRDPERARAFELC
jgi:hypothetical protein